MATALQPKHPLDSPDPATFERRHTRHPVRALAKLEGMEPDKLDSSLTVQLFDISLGGIRFLTEQSLTTGAMWRISMLQNNQQAGSQTLDIRSCKKIDENQYLIGAQFTIEPYLIAMVGINRQALDPSSALDANNFQTVDEIIN